LKSKKSDGAVHVLSHWVLPPNGRCGEWVDFAGFPTRGNAIAAGQNHANWFGSRNKVRRLSVPAFLKLKLPFIQINVPKRRAR
jgi:hypothetical protein